MLLWICLCQSVSQLVSHSVFGTFQNIMTLDFSDFWYQGGVLYGPRLMVPDFFKTKLGQKWRNRYYIEFFDNQSFDSKRCEKRLINTHKLTLWFAKLIFSHFQIVTICYLLLLYSTSTLSTSCWGFHKLPTERWCNWRA